MNIRTIPDRTCRIATGTYTGDGSTSLAVTGVGFAPKYVEVWKRQTADGQSSPVFVTTDAAVDDNASGMALVHRGVGTHESVINAIIAISADGFTVDDAGADADPNANGVTYNYLCLG